MRRDEARRRRTAVRVPAVLAGAAIGLLTTTEPAVAEPAPRPTPGGVANLQLEADVNLVTGIKACANAAVGPINVGVHVVLGPAVCFPSAQTHGKSQGNKPTGTKPSAKPDDTASQGKPGEVAQPGKPGGTTAGGKPGSGQQKPSKRPGGEGAATDASGAHPTDGLSPSAAQQAAQQAAQEAAQQGGRPGGRQPGQQGGRPGGQTDPGDETNAGGQGGAAGPGGAAPGGQAGGPGGGQQAAGPGANASAGRGQGRSGTGGRPEDRGTGRSGERSGRRYVPKPVKAARVLLPHHRHPLDVLPVIVVISVVVSAMTGVIFATTRRRTRRSGSGDAP